jgi:hypothetical protein
MVAISKEKQLLIMKQARVNSVYSRGFESEASRSRVYNAGFGFTIYRVSGIAFKVKGLQRRV